MMLVTREEADYIRKHSDEIRFAISCKKKKSNRKKIYAEEWSLTHELLEQFYKELKEKKVERNSI